MPLSGAIVWPGVAVGDLSPSSKTPSLVGCLTVAFSPMMRRWKYWQSRPTLGEPHWPLLMYRSPPPCSLLPSELHPWLWCSSGGSWRPDGAWWLKLPPSLLVLQNRRWQGSGQRGGSWRCGQQFAIRCCEPRSPYSTPLPGPALLARCHTSKQASPPWCDMVHPYHPWVWPSSSPVQSDPSRSPNSWQGSHSSATCPHCRSISTPSFITFIPAVGRLFLGHQQDHIILFSPFTPLHLTRSPGVISPSANQQQQHATLTLILYFQEDQESLEATH